MPPSPSVKAISRTKAIIMIALAFLGIPLVVLGQWVFHRWSQPASVDEGKKAATNSAETTQMKLDAKK